MFIAGMWVRQFFYHLNKSHEESYIWCWLVLVIEKLLSLHSSLQWLTSHFYPWNGIDYHGNVIDIQYHRGARGAFAELIRNFTNAQLSHETFNHENPIILYDLTAQNTFDSFQFTMLCSVF